MTGTLTKQVQDLLADRGISSSGAGVAVIPLGEPGTHTWQAEYLARFGDRVYQYSPTLARTIFWNPATAVGLTALALVGMMYLIERKL